MKIGFREAFSFVVCLMALFPRVRPASDIAAGTPFFLFGGFVLALTAENVGSRAQSASCANVQHQTQTLRPVSSSARERSGVPVIDIYFPALPDEDTVPGAGRASPGRMPKRR